MKKTTAARTAAGVLAVVAMALLTACSPATEAPTPTTPTPTADAFSAAWERCVWSHPEPDKAAAEDGNGQVMQTSEEGCQRWLDKVGKPAFIKQWTEEYAQITRCAAVLGSTDPKYADEAAKCIEDAS